MPEGEFFPEIGRSKEASFQCVARKTPWLLETELYENGTFPFAGVDEVGRGPLAGPVVACACVLPKGFSHPRVKDSKLLKENDIICIYQEIVACPDIDYAISVVDSDVIDRINILQATLYAMRQAVQKLRQPPKFLIVDGNKKPCVDIPCITVVKGDVHCLSVSVASILAKYARDALMRKLDGTWPQYGFARHKGYGTQLHMDRLQQYGPCSIHRKSFKPIQQLNALKEIELF